MGVVVCVAVVDLVGYILGVIVGVSVGAVFCDIDGERVDTDIVRVVGGVRLG